MLSSDGGSVTPYGRGLGSSVASRASYTGGPSRRNGRHSVATDQAGTGAMTLREQEKVITSAYELRRIANKLCRNWMQ